MAAPDRPGNRPASRNAAAGMIGSPDGRADWPPGVSMKWELIAQLVSIGLIAGLAGGMFGIGGGLIMVPAMVLWLGMDQKLATGTSLGAMVMPVALLGALTYHADKKLDVRASALLALGLLLGNLLGAKIASPIDSATMKKIFGCFLLLVSVRYLFFK